MIAKIAVAAANFAIDKPYSYYAPREMNLCPGMRVQVPFGRSNRSTEGVVVAVEEGSNEGLKPVTACLDDTTVLDRTMLQMAAFISQRYFCTFYDAVRAMLPAGAWFRTKQTVTLTDDRSWQDKKLRNPQAAAVLQLISDAGGQTDAQQLRGAVESQEELEKVLHYLAGKKWISTETAFLRRIGVFF